MAGAVDPVELLGAAARWKASTLIQEVTAWVPTTMSSGRSISGIPAKASKAAIRSILVQGGTGRARVFGRAVCGSSRSPQQPCSAAEVPSLLDGLGKQREDWRLLAPGGDRAGVRGGVEHGLEHGRVLGAISAEAKLAADVNGADRADRPDPMVAGSSRQHVTAGRADSQSADALGVYLGPGGQVRDGCLDVLDPLRWVFQAARLPPLSPW